MLQDPISPFRLIPMHGICNPSIADIDEGTSKTVFPSILLRSLCLEDGGAWIRIGSLIRYLNLKWKVRPEALYKAPKGLIRPLRAL